MAPSRLVRVGVRVVVGRRAGVRIRARDGVRVRVRVGVSLGIRLSPPWRKLPCPQKAYSQALRFWFSVGG